MPALRIYGRRWHTCTDMVPVPSILGLLFHGAWIVIFCSLTRVFHEWKSCEGPGRHYLVTTGGLLAVFVFSFVAELLLTGIGCRGTPLEISKRYAVVPILYFQSVNWILQAIFMVYGTVVIAIQQPSCWEGREQRHVYQTTEAMVISTWIFSVVLWLAVFTVYNAYPARGKQHTWEKRVVCVSWLLGCYKTMMQQADGRTAPLTSVAQWLSGLFGNADLTPSDLVAALVLCAAAQHQRRRMHIKHALAPVEDALSSIQPSEGYDGGEAGGPRDDGAQMYTGIEQRTLAKQTSDRSSTVAASSFRPGTASPRSSGSSDPREGREVGVHASPSEALRCSQESRRRSSVEHRGHMRGIVEASSSQEASQEGGSHHRPNQATSHLSDRPGPDQAGSSQEHEVAADSTDATRGSIGGGGMAGGNAAVISLLENGRVTRLGKAAGAGEASRVQSDSGDRAGDGRKEGVAAGAGIENGDSQQQGHGEGIVTKARQLFSSSERVQRGPGQAASAPAAAPTRTSAEGTEAADEGEEERERLHLPHELKEKLKDKVHEHMMQRQSKRGADVEMAGHKLKAPDKDTTVLPLPHGESNDIGPIWTDRDSSGEGARQAGGADRVKNEEEGSEGGGSGSGGAVQGSVAALGSYLGSWVGMSSVPEGQEQADTGTEQNPDEDMMAVPDVPGRPPSESGGATSAAAGSQERAEGRGGADTRMNRKGSVTLDLSQVDAETLRDFTRRASTAGSTAEELERAMDDFRKSKQFPDSRRISNQYPVVLTPSEQVSEQVEELNIDMEPGEIVDDILGRRKNVAFDTLAEAANYARFACAAYAVVEYQDTRDTKDNISTGCCGGCCSRCCCPCCASTAVETSDNVRREMAEVAGIEEKDVLYFSPSNEALAHLPYMIALDKKREAVVVAIRGTMSMADVVTDAVVHPEGIDDWLPPAFSEKNKHKRGTAFGHAGIVAAASAVLADLEKGGILHVLLGGDDERQSIEESGGADSAGEAVGALMQEKVDVKGYRLVVTGHSLGAGAAALISLKLRDRFKDLKCWAFCPPGGLVSESLLPALREWCVSVVCGKDAVPRMTINNLSRLMDEMVTSLARARHHKLRVLIGGWWRKEKRPPPQHIFRDYEDIPLESRVFLEKYYKSVERRGKEMDMYPPGRIIFVRPLKTLVGRRNRGVPRRLIKGWDTVWVTPKELIAEGILISGKMLEHHLLQSTLMGALDHVIQKHPGNPHPDKSAKRRRLRKRAEQAKDLAELAQVVVEGPDQQSPL